MKLFVCDRNAYGGWLGKCGLGDVVCYRNVVRYWGQVCYWSMNAIGAWGKAGMAGMAGMRQECDKSMRNVAVKCESNSNEMLRNVKVEC